MGDKALCPVCGEGHVISRQEELVTDYRGQQGTVTLLFAKCDTCGSEITRETEGRANKRAVIAFRKAIDGLLTGAEIRAIREKYGVTQAQAARLFGGGPVAFSKYENDDVAHAESMDNLLRLVRRREDTFRELVEEKGMAAELPTRPTTRVRQVEVKRLCVTLTIPNEFVKKGETFALRKLAYPGGISEGVGWKH